MKFTKTFKILAIVISLIFLILLICIIILLRKYNFKNNDNYQPNTDPQYVTIYYDHTSIPTLYQAEDFLRQSPDTTIFVEWDRVNNLEEKLKNRPNTYFLKHQIINGVFEPNNPLETTQIKEYLSKHPDAKFIIHSNNNWVKSLLPILREIPKKSIKEIHIYEDGSYTSSFTQQNAYYEKIVTDYILRQYLKEVPKIYHLEDAKRLNSIKCLLDKECYMAKKFYKDDTVVLSSIADLKKKLDKDPQIKEEFFKIFDFDYKKYQKEMKRPFGIYLFTTYIDKQMADNQVRFMNALIRGNLKFLVRKKNVKWFYKEHPSFYQIGSLENFFRVMYPHISPIEKHLPLELFVLADLTPDYIAGYSSGIFLSVPKRNIACYIKRPPNTAYYMYIIKRDKRIRPGRIFELSDIDDSNKSKFHRIVSRILVFFQR